MQEVIEGDAKKEDNKIEEEDEEDEVEEGDKPSIIR